jgi:pSer/pThr/pTyr-binding forkhead associated (FHA) protein
MIGLFIGLVEQVARSAWVRQSLGRNEGREWALYAPRSAIGRNELAQIPIFGDAAIAPLHAFIDRRGHEYWLADAGSGAPTFLNGQPIAAAPLVHGSHIQVGNTVLEFLTKGRTSAGGRQYPLSAPTVAQPAPTTPTVAMPAPGNTPTLVATDGPLAGQRYPLTGSLELGRDASGVPLGFDTSASRRHASITPSPSGLALADLGSTNGTYVNGQRVLSATLKPGDLVRIGATTFRVE